MSLNLQDDQLLALFQRTRVIAIVGLSPNPAKASYGVAEYLSQFYRIVPVNPNYDEILGITCYPNLQAIPIRVDLVDVFQRPEHMPALLPEVLAIRPDTFWMQLGITHEAVAASMSQAGISVIQNRCTKIDHQRVMSGA